MDSFQTFLKQVRENWHILTMFFSLSFFLTVAAADARSNITDQGKRLATVEAKAQDTALTVAAINERTILMQKMLERIDANTRRQP